ncbi:MAG: FeoA family protein [Myxococcota bacterium]|jgi:Fe2+ transport system protein FeoA
MHSPETSPIRLTDMAVGQSGDLTQAVGDTTPARLQELGFVAGTTVTLVRTGPLGDPVELELRGYRICLRRSDLAGLEVQLGRKGTQ